MCARQSGEAGGPELAHSQHWASPWALSIPPTIQTPQPPAFQRGFLSSALSLQISGPFLTIHLTPGREFLSTPSPALSISPATWSKTLGLISKF